MPLILSVGGDNAVFQGEIGVTVSGVDFGPVPPDPQDPQNYAALIASPSDDINDMNRLVLTVSQWSEDQLIADIPMGLPAGITFWFVVRFDGLQSVDGVQVQVRVPELPAAQVWTLPSDSTLWVSFDESLIFPVLRTIAGEDRLFSVDFSPRAEVEGASILTGIPITTVDTAEGMVMGTPYFDASKTKVLLRLAPTIQNRRYLFETVVQSSIGATLICRHVLLVADGPITTLHAWQQETRRFSWDFTQREEIRAGGHLTGVPVITLNDPTLATVGAPLLNETQTKVQAQILALQAVDLMQTTCTVTTSQGDTLRGRGNLVIA